MPYAPKHPCRQPRCGALVEKGYCERHGGQRRRGSSHARGYGARWRKEAGAFRQQHSYCGDREAGQPVTGDSRCRAAGIRRLGTRDRDGEWRKNEVDHVIPTRGPADPRPYDGSGFQTLCKSCHQAKSQREGSR